MNKKIEKVIKDLKIEQKDLDIITYGNMLKICELAKCDMLDLMKYLKYNR